MIVGHDDVSWTDPSSLSSVGLSWDSCSPTSAITMGDSRGDGRRWRRWATAGVTMEDSDSGGMIPMAVNGGGAMDGRTAATAQLQSP